MKRWIMVLPVLAMLYACAGGPEKYLSCKLNGVPFEADTAMINANYVSVGHYLLLNGGGVTSGYITAQVTGVVGPGTYEVRDTNAVYMEMFRYYPDTSYYITNPLGRMWLTIHEMGPVGGLAQKTRGRFHGVIYRTPTDSLVETDGRFNSGI